MNNFLRRPVAALAGCISIALSACGGSSSGSGDSGGAIDTPPLTAPTISAPAENQSVVKGETATFKVVATGSSLTYQWKKNGTDISDATSNSYTTPPTSSADNGAVFLVSVSNSAGSVSSNATLTVLDTAVAPAITSQPADQTAITGQTATFSVTATGTSLQYQWKKGGADIPGATNSSYTTPATSSGDTGTKYSVSVSNKVSTVTSSTATLTVSDTAVAPAITTQPTAQSVTEGQTATFLVKTTGTFLQYQWKKGNTAIPGATSSSYTTPATSMADSGAVFTVVVSNALGSVTSSNATLAVTAAVVVPVVVAPAITAQPAAQKVTEGESATFSVSATGTAPLTYQWKKGGTVISGATSSTYTTPATSIADDGAVFTVEVRNSAGTVTSSGAALTVTAAPPAISTQPAHQTITADQTATFSVTATGTAPLIYQWKKNGTDISGATSSTYTTPAMNTGGSGVGYSVVVSNSAGTVTSSNASLTVNKSTSTGYSLVANASGGNYDKTECVKENSTGLVWEGKTNNGGARPANDTFTNFDSTTSAQKPSTPSSSTYVNPTQAEIDASTNSIGYKNSVNASALCGYTDWRLPTKEELQGILASSGSPRIDTTWFPNTQGWIHWTSSPYMGSSSNTWYVLFSNGFIDSYPRGNNYHVRLVR